ncbi:MAG: adenosylmethionine--8-amino-7-oxononanoate transaminase [Proteobacteria bacterium]|nr:adenosylmethionine--8-amino-7-oxononanoate transaminase [Pseudomonadota bacterium]
MASTTLPLSTEALLAFDREHLWHPYSSTLNPPQVFAVASASGTRLKLEDGRELIDGMASWWSVIHGYSHPELNSALHRQIDKMSHVMFGGLTHRPAVELSARLLEITPSTLTRVFFSDSGSVAVEVAIKLAIQYWAARQQPRKHRLLTVRGGYHGDTFGAMAVCDPVTGMHSLFSHALTQHIFADRPDIAFDGTWHEDAFSNVEQSMRQHHMEIAAVIVEPIVQGAGGMWFYHREYLRKLRALCDELDTLLIFDEIATGFGRTGKLFACEHAGVNPDIMCLGKALTGGYMSLAATLTTADVAATISGGEPGVFMHGPTFMANPLACAVSLASIDLLHETHWSTKVLNIEAKLRTLLEPCRSLSAVSDVRILGAIGVVELHQAVDMYRIPQLFIERGVWLRPFGRLVYLMPPYIISDAELATIADAIYAVLSDPPLVMRIEEA